MCGSMMMFIHSLLRTARYWHQPIDYKSPSRVRPFRCCTTSWSLTDPILFTLYHCATVNGYDFIAGPCIRYGSSVTVVNIKHDRYKISGSPPRPRIQVHSSLDAIIQVVLHELIVRFNDVVFERPVPFSWTEVRRSSWSDIFALVDPPGLKLFMGAQILCIVGLTADACL